MKTMAEFNSGAAKSCATNGQNQVLAERCGPNGNLDPQRLFCALPAPKRERETWPTDLRDAHERAVLTRNGMRHRSFQQSAALQSLAAQTFTDFENRLRAFRADH